MDRTFRRLRSGRTATLLVTAALVAAACSTGAGTTSAPASVAASAAGTASEVTAVQDAKLGAYLVGKDGKTLYVFLKDSAGKSACSGGCATAWPPFTLDAGGTVKAGAGVNGTFASITRDDGTAQVTYDGAPLYYYAKDTKAGDVIGQGVGGVWFVASAAGGPGGASPAASPAASAATSGGRYGAETPASGGSGTAASIIDYAFSPASITVKAGSAVTWTNTGSAPHTVTADDGSFDSGSLANGATFSHTFAKAGTFTFHCAIHSTMKGTVVVQ